MSLAQAGANVALVGRDAAALEETSRAVKEAGAEALILQADVTNADSVESAVEKACASFGKLDVLVCNAGVQKLKPFLDMKPEDWRGLIATNLEGAIVTMQSVGRRMVAQKSGSVIAMASIYSFVGAPFNSIYCMTKGGLMQLSRALAVEWARYNVRVNAICPGWIETELTKPYMQDQKTVEAGPAAHSAAPFRAARRDRPARGLPRVRRGVVRDRTVLRHRRRTDRAMSPIIVSTSNSFAEKRHERTHTNSPSGRSASSSSTQCSRRSRTA